MCNWATRLLSRGSCWTEPQQHPRLLQTLHPLHLANHQVLFMPKYCLLHPQWHISSKSLIISCLENADSCFPVPGCATVELTPPILIHSYLFKMWNLITSLPRLKRFSCFPACQSHCNSLKCMIRLLISWPSSPAPLLESNASSRTSYASKKKICISNSLRSESWDIECQAVTFSQNPMWMVPLVMGMVGHVGVGKVA